MTSEERRCPGAWAVLGQFCRRGRRGQGLDREQIVHLHDRLVAAHRVEGQTGSKRSETEFFATRRHRHRARLQWRLRCWTRQALCRRCDYAECAGISRRVWRGLVRYRWRKRCRIGKAGFCPARYRWLYGALHTLDFPGFDGPSGAAQISHRFAVRLRLCIQPDRRRHRLAPPAAVRPPIRLYALLLTSSYLLSHYGWPSGWGHRWRGVELRRWRLCWHAFAHKRWPRRLGRPRPSRATRYCQPSRSPPATASRVRRAPSQRPLPRVRCLRSLRRRRPMSQGPAMLPAAPRCRRLSQAR